MSDKLAASRAFRTLLLVIGALVLLVGTVTCGKRPSKIAAPATPVFPEAQYRELIAQSDAAFSADHLVGWRRALAGYERAWNMRPAAELGDKLILTLFLVISRERDERIFRDGPLTRIRELCANSNSARQRELCSMAEMFAAGLDSEHFRRILEQSPVFDPLLFDFQGSALEAYLHVTWLRVLASPQYWERRTDFLQRFPDSALALYMSAGRARRAADVDARIPEFAEFSALMGEELFYARQYRASRQRLESAVALIPDYTKAINGLGNIYFFVLEDYAGALARYEQTLRADPVDPAGLFGTGASLHHLDQPGRSNEFLDALLDKSLSKARLSPHEVKYYQGQARYYKAYNFYLAADRVRAREEIDRAKEFLPESEHVNFLSGLLYMDAGKPELAEPDFLRVLAAGSSNCQAHYFLGLIYYGKGDTKFIEYVLSTCYCVERSLKALRTQLASADGLDVEPAERELFRQRLRAKLENYRKTSVDQVRDLARFVNDSSVDKRETYVEIIQEVLARITTIN